MVFPPLEHENGGKFFSQQRVLSGKISGPSTTKIEAPSPFNASPALVKCELAVFKPEA